MTTPADLQGEFELRGEFWLPDAPSERLAGTLRYDAGSIELNLIGVLGDF